MVLNGPVVVPEFRRPVQACSSEPLLDRPPERDRTICIGTLGGLVIASQPWVSAEHLLSGN